MAAHDPQYLFELDGNKELEEILGVGGLHHIEFHILIQQSVQLFYCFIHFSLFLCL